MLVLVVEYHVAAVGNSERRVLLFAHCTSHSFDLEDEEFQCAFICSERRGWKLVAILFRALREGYKPPHPHPLCQHSAWLRL